MPDPELTREEMEDQLMQGIEEEGEPEGLSDVVASEQVQPEMPQVSPEELQARLSEIEDQLRQKTGALADERTQRRVVEGQYAQIMDYIRDARERAASQQQVQEQDDYSEYQEYLDAWGKKYGPQVQQVVERLNNLEQFINQGYQQQQMTSSFVNQEQEFKKRQADYDDAMRFLVEKVNTRASVFYPDPQQRQAVVAMDVQRMMQHSPEQLYKLAMAEGYAKPQAQPGQPQPATQERPRPKSLAALPGTTGNLPESWQTKAQTVVNADYNELNKLSLEELDNILKNVR